MSLLAIVTFDLHRAKPKQYAQVKRKLAALKLEKQIRSKSKDVPSRLPANTFAAKFKGKWSEKSASTLRDHLKQELRKAISSLDLRAVIFVSVGRDWAWSKSIVSCQTKKDKN